MVTLSNGDADMILSFVRREFRKDMEEHGKALDMGRQIMADPETPDELKGILRGKMSLLEEAWIPVKDSYVRMIEILTCGSEE